METIYIGSTWRRCAREHEHSASCDVEDEVIRTKSLPAARMAVGRAARRAGATGSGNVYRRDEDGETLVWSL